MGLTQTRTHARHARHFGVMRASARKRPQARGSINSVIEAPDLILTEPGFDALRKAEMNIQANKPLHLPMLAAGVAAVLVSGIAIASIAISARGFDGVRTPAERSEAAALPAAAAPPSRAYRCAECGVIESTRKMKAAEERTGVNAPGRIAGSSRGEIEGKPARSYEITIRLQDGSMRVITDARSARWRQGERVTIIAGVNQ